MLRPQVEMNQESLVQLLNCFLCTSCCQKQPKNVAQCVSLHTVGMALSEDIRYLPAKKSAGHFLGCLKMEDVQKCRYIQNSWVLNSQSYHLKLFQKGARPHLNEKPKFSGALALTTSAVSMLWAGGWAWRGLTAISVFMAPNSAGKGRALYR